MPNVRALTDLNLRGFGVPYNRVVLVDQPVADYLILMGHATDSESAVQQGLLMNPDIIDLTGINPYVSKPAADPEPSADPETVAEPEPAPAKPGKAK